LAALLIERVNVLPGTKTLPVQSSRAFS
jgi:hypothetical protein